MRHSQRFARVLIGLGFSAWFGCGAPAAPVPPPGTAPNQSQPAPPSPAQGRPAGRAHADLIRVDAPAPGALVQSPLLVTGEARGTWFFEADFPVQLRDASGRLLVETYAQAKGEWMTEAFVPFFVELRFEAPPTGTGELILEKANPSDLPEHAAELRIPVRFGTPPPAN